MPLKQRLFGTNKDGSDNTEYCKFCFENDKFTQPDLIIERIIESSVSYMTKGLRMSEEKARELSTLIIPTLNVGRKTNYILFTILEAGMQMRYMFTWKEIRPSPVIPEEGRKKCSQKAITN